MKDNVSQFLSDKIGCPTEKRKQIIKLIFSGSGVVQSEDELTFEKRCLKLLPILDSYPQFKSYFDWLKPLLFSNVCEPNQRGKFAKLWTNNNCKSLNNIIKLSLDWKPQILPDLVEKLSGVTKLQMLDLRRALYDNGKYVLVPKLKKYCIAREVWVKKNEKEKEKALLEFLQRKKCAVNRVHATNVNFSVPVTSRIAKKTCQRKSRSERAK